MVLVIEPLFTLLVYSLRGKTDKSPGESKTKIDNVCLFTSEYILFA